MRVLTFFFTIFAFLLISFPALAITDPLSFSNNKVGISILFPDEIHAAAQIVNRHGEASWGYVTIPIQASDRNRAKWEEFMKKCSEEKVIPIIRVATVPNGSNWIIPNDFDLVDFANFLNDLPWPIQNRYIILFNEVNRADEFGGVISPENYTEILSSAITIFKQRSPDFFILPAALDNAASDWRNSINWQQYLWRMYQTQLDIFSQIDGWTSHAYPNPGFSSRPDLSGANKIDSYRYDLRLLQNFTSKKLPVFITEAGWSGNNLSDANIASYFRYAFTHVWSDTNVIAVTPFLYNAQDGPFKQFSFLDEHQNLKVFAKTLSDFAISGSPALATPSATFFISPVTLSATPSSTASSEANSLDILEKLYNNLKQLFHLLQ